MAQPYFWTKVFIDPTRAFREYLKRPLSLFVITHLAIQCMPLYELNCCRLNELAVVLTTVN